MQDAITEAKAMKQLLQLREAALKEAQEKLKKLEEDADSAAARAAEEKRKLKADADAQAQALRDQVQVGGGWDSDGTCDRGAGQ